MLRSVSAACTGLDMRLALLEYVSIYPTDVYFPSNILEESVKSRLTAKGDHSSTNIYVSNLSKSINETELAAIFADYKVISSILLRDPQGKSRGVGFAR
jgi:RNA recognition motif-containing protein